MPQKTTPTLSPEEAKAAGFWRLTNAYHSPGDDWMLERAIQQLGSIDCATVPAKEGGLSLWRSGRQLVTEAEE